MLGEIIPMAFYKQQESEDLVPWYEYECPSKAHEDT